MAARRRVIKRQARAMDQRTVGEAFSFPGIDPRQWCSMGTVSADDPAEVVIFDEDEGQQLVQVTLQPSKIPVFCRVASYAAGNGEGDFSPWVLGDEVIVLIPEGSEDSGCVIVGRMNNAIDKFPFDSVAGQDPTTNTFAFTRRRVPIVQEFAGPILFRSALNDGLISISTEGVVTIKDSENSVLQMSPDVIGFQGPSETETPPEFIMQLNLSDEHFTLQVKDAIINFSSSTASPAPQNTISVPDAMTIGTVANAPIEHVATAESVVNLTAKLFDSLSIAIAAIPTNPLTPAALALGITTWLAGPFAVTVGTIGLTSLSATNLAAVLAAVAATPQKTFSAAGQAAPGIGCPGLLVG